MFYSLVPWGCWWFLLLRVLLVFHSVQTFWNLFWTSVLCFLSYVYCTYREMLWKVAINSSNHSAEAITVSLFNTALYSTVHYRAPHTIILEIIVFFSHNSCWFNLVPKPTIWNFRHRMKRQNELLLIGLATRFINTCRAYLYIIPGIHSICAS